MNHSTCQRIEGRLEGGMISAPNPSVFQSLLPTSKTPPHLTTTNFAPATRLVPINFPAIPSPLTPLLACWSLKDGIYTLSHYLRKKVTIHTMEHIRRAKTSTRTAIMVESSFNVVSLFTRVMLGEATAK